MKQLFAILLLTLSLTSFAQIDTVVGEYERRYEDTDKTVFSYNLTLNTDGTFEFYRYRKVCATCKEENDYGKGTWTLNKKLISFSSNASLLDDSIHLISMVLMGAILLNHQEINPIETLKQEYNFTILVNYLGLKEKSFLKQNRTIQFL